MSSHPEPTGDRRGILPERRDAGTPKPAIQPKSYSVDEMLTQLRTPEGGKRRRRSEQPVYSTRKRRRLIITIVVIAGTLIAAGWFGFRWAQRLRIEGETFRESLNRQVSAFTGMQVEFTRVHDGGADSLAAKEARIDTRDQDLIESGTFSGLSASLTSSSWVSSEWGITLLSIDKGTLRLNPRRGLTPADGMRVLPRPEVQVSDNSGFRLTINPEPNLITLDGIRFASGLDLEWPGSTAKSKPEAIRRLRGHAKFPAPGEVEGMFVNGIIASNGLQELALEHLTWKLKGRHLDIPGARIDLGRDARMEITGSADLVPDGALDLQVNIVSTQLSALLPIAWHERIYGSLDVRDAVFHASFGKGPERTFAGQFTVTGSVLQGWNFIGKLAYLLQSKELSSLEFPTLSGHFSWSPSTGLTLTGLSAEKQGTLLLTGSLTVAADGIVKGRLKAAVTEAAIRARPNAVPHPFTRAGEGWLAREFNVSGTVSALNDDLPAQAGATINAPDIPGAPPSTNKELEDQIQELLPK